MKNLNNTHRSCLQEVIGGEEVVQETMAWFVKQAAPDFLLLQYNNIFNE